MAFRLYDTYGLPRDFIEDMIEDRKLSLDREGFERAMEGQREKARARSKFKGGARRRHAAWTATATTFERSYDNTAMKTSAATSTTKLNTRDGGARSTGSTGTVVAQAMRDGFVL